MTDDTGILQHAIFSLPNNQKGYTTDDNARALTVTTILNGSGQLWSPEHSLLSRRYLAFLWLAFNQEKGRFRNFLSYGREWQEEVGSEDSHGRALWSLGKVFCYPGGSELRGAAARLFESALPATRSFTSPRAWAFSLLGVQAYLECFPGDRKLQAIRNELANHLLDIYERSHTSEWRWFEQSLSYSNARLAEAMLIAGWQSENKRMTEVGLKSLEWLLAEQHRADQQTFVPIESRGFYSKGQRKSAL